MMLVCKTLTTDVHSLRKNSFLVTIRATAAGDFPFLTYSPCRTPLLPLEGSLEEGQENEKGGEQGKSAFLTLLSRPSFISSSVVLFCSLPHPTTVKKCFSYPLGKKEENQMLSRLLCWIHKKIMPSPINSKVPSYHLRPYFLALSKWKKINCT